MSATVRNEPVIAHAAHSHHGGTPGNREAPAVATHLQQVLVDLIALGIQGKQAHWNVVGPGFRSLHLQLDDLVADVREFEDVVAERLRALGVPADGRLPTVVTATHLSPFPSGEQTTSAVASLVAARLTQVGATIRESYGEVDAADPASADILLTTLQALEQHAWMFRSEISGA